MGLYDVNGRIFDALVFIFTFGSEEKLKERAIRRMGLEPGNTVMDWGCGTGLSTRLVEQHLQTGRIYAVDSSPAMMARAVAQFRLRDGLELRFILANGVDVGLPEKVDAVVASYSLGVLPPDRTEDGVKAIWRSMNEGAKLAVIETRISEPRTRVDHVHHWVRKKILRHFFEDECSVDLLPTIERYFEPVDIEEVPSLNAVAFVGKRRSVVIPAAEAPGANGVATAGEHRPAEVAAA